MMMYETADLSGKIRHDSDHVEGILAGEKYLTFRYRFDRKFYPGDLVMLETDRGDPFAVAEIVIVKKIPALMVPDIVDVLGGHREYNEVEEFLDHLEEYYPDFEIEPASIITMFAYKIMEVVN